VFVKIAEMVDAVGELKVPVKLPDPVELVTEVAPCPEIDPLRVDVIPLLTEVPEVIVPPELTVSATVERFPDESIASPA